MPHQKNENEEESKMLIIQRESAEILKSSSRIEVKHKSEY